MQLLQYRREVRGKEETSAVQTGSLQGKRKLLQYRREVCRKAGKSAGKRVSLQEKGKIQILCDRRCLQERGEALYSPIIM
jgi:hypothetical protein